MERSNRSSTSNGNRSNDRRDDRRSSSTTDAGYLDVVAFVKVGQDKKIKPRLCGYAKKSGDKLYVTLQTMPVPGSGWDGSLVIEKRTERDGRDERDD